MSRLDVGCVTLGSGNLRDAVKLPQGEDLNEWMAVNSKYPINTLLLKYCLESCKLFQFFCSSAGTFTISKDNVEKDNVVFIFGFLLFTFGL